MLLSPILMLYVCVRLCHLLCTRPCPLRHSGKSELINALLGRPVLPTNAFRESTKRIKVVKGRIAGQAVVWGGVVRHFRGGLAACVCINRRRRCCVFVRAHRGGSDWVVERQPTELAVPLSVPMFGKQVLVACCFAKYG